MPPTSDRKRSMNEREFQGLVLDAAAVFGWKLQYHTFDSRRSAAGYPDLTLIHEGKGWVMLIELKTEQGVVTKKQQRWLDGFTKAGVFATVWRPSDWDSGEIPRVLEHGPRSRTAVMVDLYENGLVDVAGPAFDDEPLLFCDAPNCTEIATHTDPATDALRMRTCDVHYAEYFAAIDAAADSCARCVQCEHHEGDHDTACLIDGCACEYFKAPAQ